MTEVGIAAAGELVRPLLGLPAWRVRRGIGSFVTMEFGEPLPPDEHGFVHGQWHLWVVMAAWRLQTDGGVVAGSEDQELAQALSLLEGRRLTDVVIRPPAFDTRFDFDGLWLETFGFHRPDPEEGEYDSWLLWLAGGGILVAGSRLTVEQ